MNNKIVLILTLVFSLSAPVFSQSDAKLATEIKTNFKKALHQIGEMDVYLKRKTSILSNEEIKNLKKIVEEKGLPTISMVGETTAHLFWALVMQCNSDVNFQIKVLKLMKAANDQKDIDANDFAMLVDRVLMNQDKSQLYGTQYVDCNDTGQVEQYKIAEPEYLQERRKNLNLPDTSVEKTKIIPKVKGKAQRGDPKARY